MKRVEVYTDGSATPDGKGGWSALISYGPFEIILTGGVEEGATGNRMELMAALEALKALKGPCEIHVYTDSEYLKKAFTDGWIEKWRRNGWKNAKRKPVENRDLWEALLLEASRHRVAFHWVPGHSGVVGNERADRLARKACKAIGCKTGVRYCQVSLE